MLAIAATISRNCGELGLYSSLYASLKEKRRGRAKNQLSVIVSFDFSLRNENTHIYLITKQLHVFFFEIVYLATHLVFSKHFCALFFFICFYERKAQRTGEESVINDRKFRFLSPYRK